MAAIDARMFRQTMGLFVSGVTVVAVQGDDDIHAMTANAVTSLSMDPTMVLVCVGKEARMMDYLSRASSFSINFLRAEQQALSTYFAGGWEEPVAPPFRFMPWDGSPRLQGGLASLNCELYQQVDGGDHTIVIGEVTALHQGIGPQHPLVFYNGRYARLGTEAGPPAPDMGLVDVPVHIFYDPWHKDP